MFAHAQEATDTRPVVGVAAFTCETSSPYSGLVTEKVVELLTNTKRFQVVDRTSYDKVQQELEFQKSEAFLDSDNIVKQNIAVAAEKLVTGHINKIPVYAIKNPDGSVKGYKGSVSFQLKIVDVATGLSTEAATFDGKASDLMLSPESAVTQAMQSLSETLEEYFRKNFPVSAKIVKILEESGDAAKTLLLGAGKKQGIREGNTFEVFRNEIINDEVYQENLGVITVVKLSGESFCECKVPAKMGRLIKSYFPSNENIVCNLVIKK